MKVSIQGNKGSFHHIAACHLWGQNLELEERDTFAEVFADVVDETVPVGIVAAENTITGSIGETADLLFSQPVKIIGEITLHVNQHLIVMPGTTLDTVTTVYSHPVALQQCLPFFKKHPSIKLVASADTGGSVEDMMGNKDATHGSVASSLAAEVHGAEILEKNIHSNNQNYTRFFIIVKDTSDPKPLFEALIDDTKANLATEPAKTTLILVVKHKPGQLSACLQVLSKHDINLTRIESRPIVGKPWEYSILLDMTLPEPTLLSAVMDELTPFAEVRKSLGLYTSAGTFET